MRRVAGTEIPTYIVGRHEWRARRAAGALAYFQLRRGYAPTIRELQATLRVGSAHTVITWLTYAQSLGLVERRPGHPARAWQLSTATDLDARRVE